MRHIVCFGEALIDFLNTDKLENGELPLNQFTQFPGGAPANAAVAIAKLGGNARFLGQVGADSFGDFLIESLQHYNVDTSFTLQHPTAKTALAFVFLDNQGERSFLFYRSDSADMVLEKPQLQSACFTNAGIFHFCSNTLTEAAIAEVTEHAVEMAKSHNALISFDVNLRHNLWPTGSADRDRINRFLARCQIAKFSEEELEYLCVGNRMDYLNSLLSNGSELVLVTNGGGPVTYFTRTYHGAIEVTEVDVVDTTAGGDAFIGGVLYSLGQLGSLSAVLENEKRLRDLLEFAIQCGATAVSRAGAFPALPVMADVSQFATFIDES